MQVCLPDSNVDLIVLISLNHTFEAISSTADEVIAIGFALIYGFKSLLDVR